MMPQRVYTIPRSRAVLDGVDLGEPVVAGQTPAVGGFPFPKRPTFAVGQAQLRIEDRADYERVRRGARAESLE